MLELYLILNKFSHWLVLSGASQASGRAPNQNQIRTKSCLNNVQIKFKIKISRCWLNSCFVHFNEFLESDACLDSWCAEESEGWLRLLRYVPSCKNSNLIFDNLPGAIIWWHLFSFSSLLHLVKYFFEHCNTLPWPLGK